MPFWKAGKNDDQVLDELKETQKQNADEFVKKQEHADEAQKSSLIIDNNFTPVEYDPQYILQVNHLKKYFPIKGGMVSKTVGYVKAVDGVTFNLKRGTTMGLVGESGCGKTTTGRTILRLYDSKSGGQVLFNGQEVYDLSHKELRALRTKMQIIFQDPFSSLSPRMPVGEIIGEAVREHNLVPKAEFDDYIDQVMDNCGLQPFHKDRYPHEFSGGQRQRVAIGRAIVRSPKVLLMDEPLSNLDAKLRNQMRAEIIKLREKIDTTFIYVTHDQVEAMTLGDRIVIMRDGYIQQIGTPQEVFNHPANLFVAGFIGSPQMNFFENCQLTKTAGGYTLTVMGETVTLTAEQSAKLAAAGVESRSVTAGVRPVHIALGESGIPAEVDVSELMGSELHLHLAANGQDVVAVIPTANIDPMAYARHTAVKFGFDAKLVHLFDADSEKNLI